MRALLAFLSVALIFLPSCTFRQLPTPAGVIVEGEEKIQILEKLSVRYANLQSLKSLARLRIDRDNDKVTLRLAAVYAKPDSLRLELFPLNGFVSLNLLVVHGEEVTVLDQQERRTYRGDERLLQRALGIAVNAEKAGSLLAGVVPLTSEYANYSLYRDRSTRMLTLVLRRFEAMWILSADTLNIQHSEFRDPFHGKLKAEVHYGAYQKLAEGLFPQSLELINTAENQSYQISYTRFELNQPVRQELFNISAAR